MSSLSCSCQPSVDFRRRSLVVLISNQEVMLSLALGMKNCVPFALLLFCFICFLCSLLKWKKKWIRENILMYDVAVAGISLHSSFPLQSFAWLSILSNTAYWTIDILLYFLLPWVSVVNFPKRKSWVVCPGDCTYAKRMGRYCGSLLSSSHQRHQEVFL